MNRPLRNLLAGVAVLMAVFGAAVVGYIIAGWSALDAVYMVVITFFSVGYGEVRPVDSPGLRGCH